MKAFRTHCGIGLLDGEVKRIDEDRPAPPRIVEAPDLVGLHPEPDDGIWEPAVQPGAEVGGRSHRKTA